MITCKLPHPLQKTKQLGFIKSWFQIMFSMLKASTVLTDMAHHVRHLLQPPFSQIRWSLWWLQEASLLFMLLAQVNDSYASKQPKANDNENNSERSPISHSASCTMKCQHGICNFNIMTKDYPKIPNVWWGCGYHYWNRGKQCNKGRVRIPGLHLKVLSNQLYRRGGGSSISLN